MLSVEELKKRELYQGFIQETGIEVLELEDGYCKGRVILKEMHMNAWGAVHGGMTYALADTIGGMAAMSHLGNVVTLAGNINYIGPANKTKAIIAEATPVHFGGSTVVYDVLISTEEGRHVAKATMTYFRV